MKIFVTLELGISLPLRRMLAILVACLLEGVAAHLTALAEALPELDATATAKEQRIRRFLSNHRLCPVMILPLILFLLQPILAALPEIVICMDRTHWQKRQCDVNILMVALAFQGRAIPLFWIVFDRAGNSSLQDWKKVLAPVIEALQKLDSLKDKPIIVTADREFASPKLSEWLKTKYQVESALRLKRSSYLKHEDVCIQLGELLQYFPKETTRFYPNITITQSSHFPMNVLITWGKTYKEPLIVATTFQDSNRSLQHYQQRFGIEPMFKDDKSNGFDVQNTKVTDPKRIENLWIPIAIAHAFSTLEGYRKEQQGETKFINISGKLKRPVGLFLVGLKSFKQWIRRASAKVFRNFLNNFFLFINQPIRV